MKTLRVVLNLTVAGFLSVEVAMAQEPIPDSRDPPRFRLGIEQTIGTYAHVSFKNIPPTQNTLSWGHGATDFTADYRVVDRLELGLAAGISGDHLTSTGPDGRGGTVEFRQTINTIHLNPRVSLAAPIGSNLAIAPRLGVDFARLTVGNEGNYEGGSSWTSVATGLSATPGVMLEYSPEPWLSVGTGPELAYRMYTGGDGPENGWFSEQGVRTWSVNWLLAAGVKI